MAVKTVYVDAQVRSFPAVGPMLDRLGLTPIVVDDAKEVFEAVESGGDPVQSGKQTLFITRNKGAFLKDCPGTRHYTCCGYRILHIGTFCTMDCSYCILQSYFHPPVLQYFVNHEDLFRELNGVFTAPAISRVGTGEFTDSMIWEAWTDLSRQLIPRFARQDHAILELKTKTTAVDRVLDLDHHRKTVLAWSLNAASVIKSEERGTASLAARLAAAERCRKRGYPLAFHFDPLVIHDGWEAAYRDVIHQLFSTVNADDIVYISLGSFRFMPALKKIIQKRFSDSKIVYGEFITGMDGKMRYFKPLRIELYHKIVSWIKDDAPDVLVYFCMEDDEVWQKCMGFVPETPGGLGRMLDESVIRLCGLDGSLISGKALENRS